MTAAAEKRPLQVGDRVAVYWYDGRFTGTIEQISKEGSTGFRYSVKFDSGVQRWAHSKQCRRLRKRPKREPRSWAGEWMSGSTARNSAVVFVPHELPRGVDGESMTLVEQLPRKQGGK